MQLKRVQLGWKGMEMVINRMIDAINANAPIEGAGIRLEQIGNGTLISAASTALIAGGGGAGGAGGGAGATVPVFPSTLKWIGVQWQNVDVVDPTTCAASTISVLVNTGNSSDSVTIKLGT